MIHRLELENFKGIAGRQRIDFSPLPVLFGANSAGRISSTSRLPTPEGR